MYIDEKTSGQIEIILNEDEKEAIKAAIVGSVAKSFCHALNETFKEIVTAELKLQRLKEEGLQEEESKEEGLKEEWIKELVSLPQPSEFQSARDGGREGCGERSDVNGRRSVFGKPVVSSAWAIVPSKGE